MSILHTCHVTCFVWFLQRGAIISLYGINRLNFVKEAYCVLCEVKFILQQAEVAQGVPGGLRPRICLTFGTTRVVGRQPYAPAAFTPREIPGTHFQRLSRPQGTWFRQGEPRKKSSVTLPGIDPGTDRLVAQCLNHYANSLWGTNWIISQKFHTILLSFFLMITTICHSVVARSMKELKKTNKCNVTLRCVRATTVSVEKQWVLQNLCVFL